MNNKGKKITNKTKKTTSEQEPKKISNLYKIILSIALLILFIISVCLYGFIISLFIMLVFVAIIALTIILDKYPKRNKKRKIVKTICIIILILGIIGICAFIAFFTYIASNAPEFDIEKLSRNETTILYDSDGKAYATLGTEMREKVTYDELPEILIDAIIATEDARFFQHNGFDAPRFFKAMIGQLTSGSEAGGASTLTMQVSKNNFTNTISEGFAGISRKFTDIYLSIFKLEKAFTKQEIIEYYVNAPYLGEHSYGVEQASKTYFNKSVSELNLAEASLIAGLFQAPSAYNPIDNPEDAYERRETVLSLMVLHGYITEEQKEIASQIKISSLLKHSTSNRNDEFQDYIDTVVSEIVDKTDLNPYDVPMEIYTNMDRDKQLAINKVFKGKTFTWANKDIQGAAAAIESTTGKIIAIGAGRNRSGELTYNYATDIKRQIGSTAKPLFDYAPGIEFNNWSTATTFLDSRYTYSDGTIMTNYDNGYRGKMTLREALRDSRNVTALKAFQAVDNAKIKKFVTTLGIRPEIDSTGYLHEAHSIGAFNGASPLQMAGAYAAFSNKGYYNEPYSVSKIVLRDSGEEIEFKSEKVKAMSDATAYMITSVLQGVAQDTGIKYVTSDQVAVKTGTTNYDRDTLRNNGFPDSATPDGWIAGYTPNIALAIWTGYNEIIKGSYLTQSQMVTQRNGLYKACAKAVFDSNGATFKKPSSVVSVTVEKGTDPLALPSANTPAKMKITELFKRGTEPTKVSNRYHVLDNVTGLSLDSDGNKVKLTWNRVNEPNDIEGDGAFGYKVYLNNTFIGFTTNNYFNYEGNDIYGTYTVKTSYEKSQDHISSGAKVSLELNISFQQNVQSEINLKIGDSYVTPDTPVLVFENGIDVTSNASITTSIKDNATNQIVNVIDTTKAGEYTITYNVSYKSKSDSFTQKVIITSPTPPTPPEPEPETPSTPQQ